jgi:hypothetical protein
MDRIVEEHLSTGDFIASGGAAQVREDRLQTGNPEAVEAAEPLIAEDVVHDLRGRWDMIQASFVDEPRLAVKRADELVASAIQRLAESFSGQRTNLERQWDRGDLVSTEDLRVALKKYRAFFQRLLAV